MKVTDSKGKAHLECLNLICFGNLRQNRWVKVNTLGNNKPEKTLLRVFNSCVFNWGLTIGLKQGKMNQLRQQATIMLMKKIYQGISDCNFRNKTKDKRTWKALNTTFSFLQKLIARIKRNTKNKNN